MAGYAVKKVTLEKYKTRFYNRDDRDGYFPESMTNHKNPATPLTA